MNHEIESRVTSFLGLCLRAGRLTTGQEACVELVRRGYLHGIGPEKPYGLGMLMLRKV